MSKSARSLFLDALELPPDQWPAYVETECAADGELKHQVNRLLAAHQKVDGFMNQPAVEGAATVEQSREPIGAQIGAYELKEQIGEGGMGIVYVAEQKQPIKRFVALKVIKPGMDSKQVIARFEAERQALAIMDHPNIARVIDGGTTAQGRPYFVMELVRGVPITEFCDAERLTIRERLKLFCQVCEAVQHAHQKGIIHRDLKPSNVLVTRTDEQPIPKVIDFGIAKAVNQPLTDKTIYSQIAHVLGTPLYMSPEQAQLTGLDIDTRSDVFSLGVLLYELLTGTTPFAPEILRDQGLDEFRRLIREEEPAHPSHRISTLAAEAGSTISAKRGVDPRRLRQLMRGELDWIAIRCLEKERNRRYQSASDISADVQRYLDNEAVSACPPSNWYRFRKVVQRNRGVFTAAAFIILALLIGLSVSLWQIQQANLARLEAETHRKGAEQAKIDADGHRIRAELALKDADAQRKLAEAGYKLAREPIKKLLAHVAEEKFIEVPGMRGFYVGLLNDAASSYTKLIAMHPEEADLYVERGETYRTLGSRSDARRDFEKAIALDPKNAKAHVELAKILSYSSDAGDRERALNHVNRAIELAPKDIHFRCWKVTALRALRRFPEMRAEVASIQANFPPTLESVRNAAVNLYYAGDYAAALPYAQRAVEFDRNGKTGTLTWLGEILAGLGRDEEAITALTESIELFEEHGLEVAKFPFEPRGNIYLKQKKYEAALADYDQHLKVRREAHIYKRRALCHFQLGNYDKALADLEAAMQGKPPDLSALTWINPELVENCADENFRKGMRELHERYAPKDVSNPRSLWNWSLIYRSEGRFEEEREALEKAVELWNTWPKPDFLERGGAQFRLRNYEAAVSDIDKFMELYLNDTRRWFSPADVAESPPDVQQNVLELMAKWILLAKPEASLAIRANRADLYLALDEPDSARDDIEELLKDPNTTKWDRFRPVLERLQADSRENRDQ